MATISRSALEMLALAVTLVAGFFYFDELGRPWLFWMLSAAVAVFIVGWRGRRRVHRLLQRLR
ncbi:MAG: hypothetical protein KQH83_12705 [Actinobacteria bacterium]|nr:hypothetical protein [Actinomycetota bacterium]